MDGLVWLYYSYMMSEAASYVVDADFLLFYAPPDKVENNIKNDQRLFTNNSYDDDFCTPVCVVLKTTNKSNLH